jgi:hypothetical protein
MTSRQRLLVKNLGALSREREEEFRAKSRRGKTDSEVVTSYELEVEALRLCDAGKLPYSSRISIYETLHERRICDKRFGDETMKKPSRYLSILHGYKKDIRRTLGLPEITLEPGGILLRTVQHIPGIHAEFIYIASNWENVQERERRRLIKREIRDRWRRQRRWE